MLSTPLSAPQIPAKFNGPGHVDPDGTFAPQDAGEHCHALFGKGVGQRTTASFMSET
jgi:hypothetical protein